MKLVKFSILFLFSTSLFANVFIDKDVYDLLDELKVNSDVKELVIDSIYDAYPEFGLGDDGKDCPSEVLTLELVTASSKKLQFKYQANQDYAGTYGCMDIPAVCELTVNLDKSDLSAVTSCSFF